MAICSNCGCKFDVDEARSRIDEVFGNGMYDYECSEDDLCFDCAQDDIGAALGTYDEMSDYMACD